MRATAVDALVVMVWVLIGLRAAVLILVLTVPRPDPPPAGRPTSPVDPCLGAVTGLPPRRAPDAALQARLFSGAISRDEYRAAMERLAAQDEREHPAPSV